MKNLFIDILAFGALLSSVLVITSKNPVIAVIFLISVFVNAAGYLILLGVGFIGISYIIVYVGAIAVLFLFVIMLLNIRLADILEAGSQYTKNLPLAIGISSLFAYELFSILPFSINNNSIVSNMQGTLNFLNGLLLNSDNSLSSAVYLIQNPALADYNFTSFTQVQVLGQYLYSTGGILLITLSIVLLLAMVAPIFLTKTTKNNSTPVHQTSTYKVDKKVKTTMTLNRGYHSLCSVKPIKQDKELHPWLVTGLTDAEGCFSIGLSVQPKKIYFTPIFTYHMHLNELDLMNRIKNFFGVGTVRVTKNSVHYRVTSTKDLAIICEHFKNYPLQSSKNYSLIIFNIILNMMANKEHLTKSGFLKLTSYLNFLNKPLAPESLQKIERLYGTIPFLALTPVLIPFQLPFVHPYLIVGFIIGDGGFTYSKFVSISKKSNETRIYFSMQMFAVQLKMDTYLLRTIANYLGGSIRVYENNTIAQLVVSDRNSILHLILPFFNSYPLIGNKKKQYDLWIKAVLVNLG